MTSESYFRVRTCEEEDELQRSTKKVKENPTFSITSSYRDKLMGEMPGAYYKAFDISSYDDENLISDDESETLAEGLAAVKLSKEKKSRIRAQWSNVIIVKVFGRTVGFHFLHSKISSLRKPGGRLDVVDLGKDFFLVRFGLKEDLDKVLKGGPWFIGEHFLTIRPWVPNFRPSTASLTFVAVWARFPELPIEYYDAEVLKEIGEAIGPVLRIDSHTASGSRGRYARVCVQIDLEKRLIKEVVIGKLHQQVQYEGLHSFCFSCGQIGHKKETCQYKIREPKILGESPSSSSSKENKEDMPVQEDSDDYGPWIVVARRKPANKTVGKKPVRSEPDQLGPKADPRWAQWPRWQSKANIPIPSHNPTPCHSEGKRKGEQGPCLDSIATRFAGAKLLRTRAENRAHREEDVGEHPNSPTLLGHQILLHTSPDLPSNNKFHYDALPEAKEDGDNETFDIPGPSAGVHQPLSEEDRMESDGAEEDASV
ncbi:uncharacterized protein LOC111984850 [Quercus suber]|uniref:uncharacterized protein LOC111984850 n=1 Tax=Quercus suber TaxID=58331 RepID=UPI000CE167D0|nr:uncharacterized protein LOC111984850 [Quercus suber]POF23848.1 uncharacterized protein CFP56_51699 [Quercus suber]